MNFCMETDKYISLYIDDLLGELQKEELLKHIKECSSCAKKFQEATLLVGLCRQSEDIQLPADFSLSLHKRLVELSADENKSKEKLFFFNKKWVAGFSTAAVLVISLLAYNLLPHVDYKKNDSSMAGNAELAQDTADSAAKFNDDRGGDQSIESAITEKAEDSAESADVNAAMSAAMEPPEVNKKIVTKFSSAVKQEAGASKADASKADANGTVTKEQEVYGGNEKIKSFVNEDSDQAALKDAENNENQAFSITGMLNKYYLNSAELSLQVTTQKIETDVLKQLLSDLGAEEIPPQAAQNSGQSTQEFVEYNLPWNQYYELINKAANEYHLNLTVKKDVVQTDITNEYNDLTEIKAKIDAKIEEAKAKGEDITLLEIKQKELAEKINNILVKNNMIWVRIFICR